MVNELKLTNEDLVIINKALMNLPYYEAAPLISNINNQLIENSEDLKETKDKDSDK